MSDSKYIDVSVDSHPLMCFILALLNRSGGSVEMTTGEMDSLSDNTFLRVEGGEAVIANETDNTLKVRLSVVVKDGE